MGGHCVECDADGDLEFFCEAGTDDWCTVVWEGCDCEQLYDLTNDGDGVWSHRSEDAELDERHVGKSQPGSDCNYLNFITGDDARDFYDGIDHPRYDEDDNPVQWPSGPITFTWDGDYYSWDYAAEVTG